MSKINIIFTAILFLSFAFSFGQDAELESVTRDKKNEVNYSQIFTAVQVQASPPGGMNVFRKKIASLFSLPEVDVTKMGSVVAKFVVWEDGSIRDIMIIKEEPHGLGLGKEYVRLLKESEKWIPGTINGKSVKQYYTLPISFEIPAIRKKDQPIKELKNEKLQLPDAIGNFKTPKDSLEIQPEPIEGFKTFYSNIQKNIQIPENVLTGRYTTKVSFIVTTDGSLADFKIVEETPKPIGLGEEVISVLKTFPKWKPGTKKTFYMLPVTTLIEKDPEPEPKKD